MWMGAGRRLAFVCRSMASVAAGAPLRVVVPALPAPFMARLRAAAADAGKEVELLVADGPEEAGELLASHDVSALIDSVEMGAPSRWACTAAVCPLHPTPHSPPQAPSPHRARSTYRHTHPVSPWAHP